MLYVPSSFHAAGITPDSNKFDQVSKAVSKLITDGGFLKTANNLSEIKTAGAAAVAQTLLNLGLGDAAKLGVASNAQMQTGTSTTLLPTVAAVMSLFSKCSFSINDYIRIPDVPGGLIIQWGTTAVSDANGLVNVTLPTNFPSSNGLCAICAYYSGSRNSISTQIASITQTTMQMFASQSTTGAAAVGAPLRYIVIGF